MSSVTVTRPRLVLAFLAIYLIWGSTYLAMRYVVETVPPFLGAAMRAAAAGIILFTFARLRGAARPTPAQWRHEALVGILLLVGGNGMVMWAEQTVDSGLAALIIATVPLWMAVLQAAGPERRLPGWITTIGLLIGFAGVALLILPGIDGSPTAHTLGLLGLVFAAASWAAGSLVSRRGAHHSGPIQATAMQFLTGTVALLSVSGLRGEFTGFRFAAVTGTSWWALAYLVLVGSVVGYSCYIWLLRATTPALVSTYAYVNPLVAIALGAVIAGERLAPAAWTGSVAILLGVVLIVTVSRLERGRPTAAPGPVAAAAPDPEP